MLMGLVRPTAGHATVLGEPITHPSRYLRRVGALIESPAFYPALSGRRNLLAQARIAGDGAHRVDDLLAQVGLADRGHEPYRSYSLGMKQRLGIAATLLTDPELLILDEPTNGLDPSGIHEMRDFLVGLARSGKTVFVSSHLLAEVQRMCQHLVILRKGRLVYQGPVDGLQRQARVLVAPQSPGLADRLGRALAAGGFTSTPAADGALSVLAPPERAADLNALAQRAGITLRLLAPQPFDLEETVLGLTGAGTP